MSAAFAPAYGLTSNFLGSKQAARSGLLLFCSLGLDYGALLSYRNSLSHAFLGHGAFDPYFLLEK